jgi:uncharacterized phiE125 gp8 family phage protein
MSLTIISAAAAEPITLAEARAQCRIDGTDEDALLEIYIAAARGKAEHITGRRLITQTWRQTLDAFPASSDIRLEVPPVASIAQVQYVDTAGTLQTLAGSAYVLDAATGPAGWLLPADGTSWPSTDDVVNAVRIDIVAGYGAAGSAVPADLRAWLLLTVAYLYAQREAVDATGKSAEIPSRFVDALLDAHRVYGL